ncbi:hypothetical protein C1646_689952 [Rhizophagus diaphanus]|nr:hypothetical protein C1646_689952 [Rhizophagus diaphanus] [Rhizophagus sp. MUCL 43196]
MRSKIDLPPSRKPNLKYDKSGHLPLFASWIDKKNTSHYNRENNPYDFKLLYRSSQDGVDARSFHCDNKGATIWIAKIKNSTQIIGGYNPLDWNGDSVWNNTTDSFIFNFTNGKNISTSKISYVNNRKYADFCNIYGPTMSNLFLCINNKSIKNSHFGIAYPNIIGNTENFIVEDYEVFQIIKK